MTSRAIVIFVVISISIASATDYYVDSARTSNGDGSLANPWKLLSDINWATASNSANSATTTVYFSSRASWNPPSQEFTGKATGSASFRLILDGDSKYNLTASGTAVWIAETTGSRATMTGGANFALESYGTHDFTLKGFFFDQPLFSAVYMLSPGATVANVWNVSTINCACNSSINGHGYAGDNMAAGCSNILVQSCQFSNTIGEAIYMTKFDGLVDKIRGIVIESNLLVNCGLPGHEGDIDLKPGAYGAIVRYNTVLHTSHATNGPFCGVVVGADTCQVYNNTFSGAETNTSQSWGVGVFINSDGDGSTGKAITSCLVYNNLIYDCEGGGIKITATTSTSGADVSGVILLNNTIHRNWDSGLQCSASGGRTIALGMTNNLFLGNTNYDVLLSSSVTLVGDYNLYYRGGAAGASWNVAGVDKTFATWKTFAGDSHAVNSDPSLDASFVPTAGSVAIDAGANLATIFVNDRAGNPRGSIWEIGAYAVSEASIVPTSPRLRWQRMIR